jgi:hypothetical protein
MSRISRTFDQGDGFGLHDLLPVDVREGVVGQSLAHAALDEIGRRVHPGGARSSTIARALRSAACRLSWAWMALSIWLTSRTLVAGT